MFSCCCPTVRCPCGTCCLSDTERDIRATADMLFDVVNTETNCCGCKDESLSQTETMLLLQVLSDESRHSLRMHGGLIASIIQQLRLATSEGTDGGREITRDELRRAVLTATSTYQKEAISAIATELARDYAALAGQQPLSMDRGLAPGQGARRLLPP